MGIFDFFSKPQSSGSLSRGDSESSEDLIRQATDANARGDQTEATRLLRLAAQMGDINAQYHFGKRLVSGVGVAKNEQQGWELIRTAARGGRRKAAFETAVALFYSRNFEQSVEWFEMAVEAGNEDDSDTACSILTYMYMHGIGVSKDLDKASEWIEKGKGGIWEGDPEHLPELPALPRG